MPNPGYLIAAVLIAGAITFTLRALPFAILRPLRRSKLVQSVGTWMPAGILVILATTLLYDTVASAPGRWWAVCVATGVTVLVHLCCKRRALLSIAAGTAVYILLLQLAFDA